jgi:hypothetical protein
MFDSNSLGTSAKVRDDLSLKLSGNIPVGEHTLSKKTHHFLAAEMSDTVVHQSGIDTVECLGISKHDVRRPLALVDGPIVLLRVGAKDLAMARMEFSDQGIEVSRPIDLELGIGQRLGVLRILEPRESISSPAVAEAPIIEIAAEPFASIDPHLNVEREPALQSHVHEAEARVMKIVVEEQALAVTSNELEFSWSRDFD